MNKKIIGVLIAFTFVSQQSSIFAQNYKDIIEERKEIRKSSRKELNEKASKDARKEAKRMKKEGWTIAPGALPLEKQLDKSYIMQYEYDEDMFPKYIIGEAMSIGENYDAAKIQALELAKQNLAGQIQTEITALIENSVANKQLEAEEAASITETVLAGKNLISQSIGRTIPVMECYREKSNKNKEVLVRIAYNSTMSKAAAKRAVRETLEDKSEDLQNKLDKILGW